MSLYGLQVVFDASLADRVRVRRHRKSRIDKKWAKDPRSWRVVPRREVIRFGDRLIVHPEYWNELKRYVPELSEKMSRDFYGNPAAEHPARSYGNRPDGAMCGVDLAGGPDRSAIRAFSSTPPTAASLAKLMQEMSKSVKTPEPVYRFFDPTQYLGLMPRDLLGEAAELPSFKTRSYVAPPQCPPLLTNPILAT